jgi:hypothetical protein
MSVVAARIIGRTIEIASDSIKVRWCTQLVGKSKLAKLWQAGPLVIGGVGTCEEIALLRLYSLNHQPESKDDRGILAYMGEFVEWKFKRSDKKAVENSYLIVWAGRLYHVEGLLVEEIATYEAIGGRDGLRLGGNACGRPPL